jgi:hypothetical protein
MMLKLFIDDILKAEHQSGNQPWELGSFQGNKSRYRCGPGGYGTSLARLPCKNDLIKNLVDKQEIKEKVLGALRELS